MIVGLVVGVLGYFLSPKIKKHELVAYIIATSLSIILLFTNSMKLLAELGMGFFIVVMYAGAFNNRSLIGKRLRSIRKEYSIIGFIFGFSHSAYYILDKDVEIVGLITLVLMIPLTITSFISVRKKMVNKSWKLLHKLSYFVYFGLFLHVILLEQYPYIIAFGLYLILKIVYLWKKFRYNKVKTE
ncbi:MAG: hypothetical protein AB7V00_06045 [Bacilli bacterium]